MEAFPLMFALVVGFTHAFEADHLVAVGNIVTKRNSTLLAIKDGIYWGLGHTSTIFLIGLIIIVGRATFLDGYFGYFEAGVGLMLIILGIVRLYQWRNHKHTVYYEEHGKEHQLAYGIGLIHGIAGSGAMVLLVMTEIESTLSGMLYLIIFGVGSIMGMLVAAGIFSLPFSRRISSNSTLQSVLIILSSLLCIGYGGFVIVENLV